MRRAAARVSRILGVLLCCVASEAWGQEYLHTVVSLAGDTAPGTGGGTYSNFAGDASIDAARNVSFSAFVTGGSVGEGIFAGSSGADTAVALPGDPAPDTGGGAYSGLSGPALDGSGELAFFATVTGGSVGEGVFVVSGGTDTAVALPGDVAPGTGGTYSSVAGVPSINASGEVAFHASVAGGSVDEGIFVDSGGTDAAVALPGDAAPGTGGGTYASLAGASINASGAVAFTASVAGGSVSMGIFVDSGGTDTAVALVGDAAPGTGGGTYSSFIGIPSINAAGDVAFFAFVSGGSASEGIFVDAGGTDTAVALPGDPAPGTGGGTYAVGLASSERRINASGQVVFYAGVTGGSASAGVFVDSGGTDTAVALAGDPAPGTGGGTYADFSVPSINALGDVAFHATVTGGSSATGIFEAVVGAHGVPALGAPALALACLALTALLALRRG